MPDSPQQEMIVRITKTADYRVFPVNCVWGGSTPRGDILVDLCCDSYATPTEVTHEKTLQGGVGKELRRDNKNVVDRVVFAGMVLSPFQAYSIGEWLMQVGRAGWYPQQPQESNGGRDG